MVDARRRQLARLLSDNREDLAEYRLGLKRLEEQVSEAGLQGTPSLRAQNETLDGELKKQRGPWLAQIDKMWTGLERDLNGLATESQRSRGYLKLTWPDRKLGDARFVDEVLPYFLTTVGVCLIVGLFTRLAATGAACFLGMVVIGQWPGAAGAAPTYYQWVELLALLVLATTAAGRFAGLDYLLYGIRMWCCPPKRRTNDAPNT